MRAVHRQWWVAVWLLLVPGLCGASGRYAVDVLSARELQLSQSDGTVRTVLDRLSLSIRGRHYTLRLQPSEVMRRARVVRRGRAERLVDPRFYQGDIEGVADSWVRISWFDRQPTGVLRLGEQLWLLDLDAHRQQVMASDVHTLNRRLFLGLLHRHGGIDRGDPQSFKVLPVSVVLDTLFDEHHGHRGLRRALTVVNSVDGLYREQLGLAVELRVARVLGDPRRDPMRPLGRDIDQLLATFRQYRLDDEALVRGQGAVHLFSGARLADKRVGLAYIDTICRTDGYDVGVSRVVDRDIFTFAHELAHNIGAEHDLDTQCGDRGRMMNATLRSRMLYAFSQCSVASLRRGMQRACVLNKRDDQLIAAGLLGGAEAGDEQGAADSVD